MNDGERREMERIYPPRVKDRGTVRCSIVRKVFHLADSAADILRSIGLDFMKIRDTRIARNDVSFSE